MYKYKVNDAVSIINHHRTYLIYNSDKKKKNLEKIFKKLNFQCVVCIEMVEDVRNGNHQQSDNIQAGARRFEM